jgi:CRISPR-associated protein (TIGR02710 family)
VSARPTLARLPADLATIRDRWLASKLDRAAQDALYATEFAAPFASLFADLPLHGAPPDLPRPRGLVSVLGFSWQPVALMAAWARPERLVVIGTAESLALHPAGEPVLSLIARVSGVSRDAIHDVAVGDPGETEIYRAIRDFLRSSVIPARQVYVDPTGGKKSMSASTALAAFLEGAPLVYVDYGEYHAANRIPVAGTEYPRLLANPLDVLGDLELRDVFRAFDRGDFREAEHLARRLADRLYEPRQAEVLALLARGYGAWDRFEFAAAQESLAAAQERLVRFASQGGWSWATTAHGALAHNLPALCALSRLLDEATAIADGAPLLAWYVAAAGRLLDAGKPSLAVLLTYAAVERYVDLVLRVDFGLDDEEPDYSVVEAKIDGARYDQAGKAIFGKKYVRRELAGPLMFGNGAQLLATLSEQRLRLDELGKLQGLSNARNKCEFEHGLVPRVPCPEQVRSFLEHASAIVARAYDDSGAFLAAVEACAFPRLGASTRKDGGS